MNCYFQYNFGDGKGQVVAKHTFTGPCQPPASGAIVQCCDIGDTCQSDGFCLSSDISPGGSGYYLAGCTDPSFSDPACPSSCAGYGNSDVVYDYTANAWRCCGNNANGQRDCGEPEGPLFADKAPSALLDLATIVATGSGIPLATAPATTIAAASSAATTSVTGSAAGATQTGQLAADSVSPSAPGLSTGAGIAIGAAVAAAVVAVAAAVAFCAYRSRKRRKAREAVDSVAWGQVFHSMQHAPPPTPSKFGSIARPAEMAARSATDPQAELP